MSSLQVVCISDTHSKEKSIADIPMGDVLIHAGDFTSSGKYDEVKRFRNFIDSLPHLRKIAIAGNHDITMQTDLYVASTSSFHSALLMKNKLDPFRYSTDCKSIITQSSSPLFTYLEDNYCMIDNLKVYGSPWQPEFYNWAFNLPRGEALKDKWDQIPEDTDVLITHGPPMGILDKVNSDHVGCADLLEAVRRIKPRLHIFGHIHEGYGTYFDGTTLFVNASTCTLNYRPTNPPIVIDLPLDKSKHATVVQVGLNTDCD